MHNDSVNIFMFTIGGAFARPRTGNAGGAFLRLRAPVACSVTLDPPQH
jgi:hypothetical protein